MVFPSVSRMHSIQNHWYKETITKTQNRNKSTTLKILRKYFSQFHDKAMDDSMPPRSVCEFDLNCKIGICSFALSRRACIHGDSSTREVFYFFLFLFLLHSFTQQHKWKHLAHEIFHIVCKQHIHQIRHALRQLIIQKEKCDDKTQSRRDKQFVLKTIQFAIQLTEMIAFLQK